jgi:pyruvate formate lyase activating enzyme
MKIGGWGFGVCDQYNNNYKEWISFCFMKIIGLQKMSVIDFPGEVCCTIFLHGCNFRCGFCYNPDLVLKDSRGGFSEKEILNFLEKRRGKIDGVCITGGEPLMTLDLDFVRKIKEMGFRVKIDTNGSFPSRLKEMIELKLVDYIAMDVKGVKGDYEKISGVNVDISKIEDSIKIVNGFSNGEFRTTVVPGLHDAYSLRAMGKWLNMVCGGKPRVIFLQGFKSGQEMIDSSFREKRAVLEGELKEMAECLKEFFGKVEIRC